MKKVNVGKIELLLYSDPEELSVELYKRYTKYLAIASDIGDDFAAVDKKLSEILLVAGDKGKTVIEVNNLRQALYNIYNVDISIDSKLFALMVYSIDGIIQEDKSDEGLERIIKKLKGLTVGEIKKKTMK